MGTTGSKGDPGERGPKGDTGPAGTIDFSSLSDSQKSILITKLQDTYAKLDNPTFTNNITIGDWKIKKSGEDLCMQNGTNNSFCIDKYGVLNKKVKIFFTDLNKCLDSNKINTNNSTLASDCSESDNLYYYYDEGGLIKLYSDPTKCLAISDDNKLIIKNCDISDSKQYFNKHHNTIQTNTYRKCIDQGNSSGIWDCGWNSNNQVVSFKRKF
jgi:hypothetical protein